MTNTGQTADVVGAPARSRSGSKLLVTLLLLLVAIALFAGSVFWLGGVSGVMGLLGLSGPPAPKTPAAVPVAVSTPTSTPAAAVSDELVLPPGVSEDLAKRMYVEQIQSQTNLNKMADGDVTRFRVTDVKVTKKSDKAAVYVRAYFKDGTSAPGVLQLVRRSGSWYVMSVTGLSSDSVLGSAATVQQGTLAQSKKSDVRVIEESGISTFDTGVINTMLAEQVANQTIIKSIVDGTLTRIELGRPEQGVSTTLVPSKLTGDDATPVDGEVTMITKTVDHEDYIFMVGLKVR